MFSDLTQPTYNLMFCIEIWSAMWCLRNPVSHPFKINTTCCGTEGVTLTLNPPLFTLLSLDDVIPDDAGASETTVEEDGADAAPVGEGEEAGGDQPQVRNTSAKLSFIKIFHCFYILIIFK